MAKFRFLDIARPFVSILPDVVSPARPVPFNMKLMFTSLALLLFLSISQVKPAGTLSVDTSDPLSSVRASIGATHGTLGEMGVLPILTAGFGLQLLASARILDINYGLKEERALFGTAQKLFAILAAIVQATFLILSGIYGAPSELGPLAVLALVTQLVAASIVFILLDEVIQKGHGLGSGTMLFVGAHACTTAVWGVLSPRTLDTTHGSQYEGAFPALLYFIFSWNSYSRALTEAFWRTSLPNLVNVAATVAIGAAAAFIGRLRLEFPVKHVRVSSQRGAYPVKLLYTGVVPLMALAALRANLLIVTYAAAYHLPPSLPVRLIFGTWNSAGWPVSGLVAALAPPTGLFDALTHPIRTVAYTGLSVVVCALFSSAWVTATGSEAYNIVKQLQEQQLTMLGFREGSMSKELKRAIPTAALLSGAVAAVFAVLGDALGAIGGGACALIGVTIVQTYMAMGMMESGYGDVPGAMAMAESF